MMFKKSTLMGLGSSVIMLLAASCTTSNIPLTEARVNQKVNKKVNPPAKTAFIPPPASAAVLSKAASLPKDKHGMPTYTKQTDRTRYVRTTAYSHMENEPGAPGRMTASGSILKYGTVRSAAADWSVYPLGTTFRIKGLPYTYVVDDYGSALVGTNTIDIFQPSLRLMNKWGTRKTEITVVKWGSYERSLKLLKGRRGYAHCRRMFYACQDCVKKGLTAN